MSGRGRHRQQEDGRRMLEQLAPPARVRQRIDAAVRRAVDRRFGVWARRRRRLRIAVLALALTALAAAATLPLER